MCVLICFSDLIYLLVYIKIYVDIKLISDVIVCSIEISLVVVC